MPHPLAIVFGILVLVALIGVVVSLVRGKSTFSGYEELTADARGIARGLSNAETFRDGNDLVISGNFLKLPTIVRFSYDENTPGLNIHMKAPATFTMSVVPKGARATEGRVLVRTPDDMFDARFTTRSDNPTQAKMFTSGRATMQALQKVCCSSKTFFTVTPGAIELSELVIPQPYTAQHVKDHIGMMGQLARQLSEMPGSESVKIRSMQREKSPWPVRLAVAAGVVMAVIVVIAATKDFGKPSDIGVGQNTEIPLGMSATDARSISNLKGWRLATDADFSPAAVAWLHDNDQNPAGRMLGDFSGQGGNDSSYLLINDQTGQGRVILIGHGIIYYDAVFDKVAAIAKMSRDAISRTEWEMEPKGTPAGEGLAVVLDANDPHSGMVYFLEGSKLLVGKPADYQRLRLD